MLRAAVERARGRGPSRSRRGRPLKMIRARAGCHCPQEAIGASRTAPCYLLRMDSKRLFEDALRLPEEARAALAAELIATLDDESDPNAEALWSEEIRRRLEEVDSGAVRPIPWSEARRRIMSAAGRDPNV